MWDLELYRKTLIEMHGIRNADVAYTIYFDETNNIAKLRLNAGKLNVSDSACYQISSTA